jgi:hypothetical protein
LESPYAENKEKMTFFNFQVYKNLIKIMKLIFVKVPWGCLGVALCRK